MCHPDRNTDVQHACFQCPCLLCALRYSTFASQMLHFPRVRMYVYVRAHVLRDLRDVLVF